MYKPMFAKFLRTSLSLLLLLVICLLTVGNSSAQMHDSVCAGRNAECPDVRKSEVQIFQTGERAAMVGNAGNALNFDGVNDSVSAALPALFTNPAANNFTFEAWVYPTGNVFSRIIFAQSDVNNFASMSINTDNRIFFYVVAGGVTYSVATNASLPINNWTHVAARWTAATNATEVFFNGTLQTATSGGTSSTGTNNTMTLGTRPGGAQFFPGTLDEVRVWRTARTQYQIASLYNFEINAQPDMVAYYKFNQGIASGNNAGITNLIDSSFAVNNGTLSNFALSGNASNWIGSTAPITATTAASVSISGRVLEQNGRGIAGAIVSLTDMNGEIVSVRTNQFGYFRFSEVTAGQTYIFSAKHKAHNFTPQVINVLDEIQELTLIADNP